MTPNTNSVHHAAAPHETTSQQEEQKTLRSYLLGFLLAVVLTCASFSLVYWPTPLPHSWPLVAIGVLAVLQVAVHFYFFLHISFRQNRDDLQLILFSTLLMTIMVAGTVWIMTSLGSRMAM